MCSSVKLVKCLRLGVYAALVAVTACALQIAASMTKAQAQNASQGKKVALLLNAPFLPFPARLKMSFLERAKQHGFEVTLFEQNFDPARQAQQVDDAIARKFDLIAVMLASEQAIIPALIRAKAANVPVVITNSPPKDGSEELYTSFVGEDFVEMGKVSGESMLQALKDSGRDGGKIALITGTLNEGVAPRRLAGIKAALAKNPKVQIVAVDDARWDPVAP
ncbi:MAG: sugar ABC transporter substrate-binding protein, partial [Pseudolabrys sp.]